MFRNTYQNGWLSVFYSCGAAPLELWGMQVKNGCIRRVTDGEVNSLALEISGTNVATTYIYAPKNQKSVLAINLPFLIMIIKNMKKYFTFEITILDDKRMHRRFRISNFQSTTKVRPFCTSMPIGLPDGWSQIQFNLADFTRRAYGSNYIETTRMQIHANCRIRRIYFSDRLYTDDELPEDYKLLFPARQDSSVRESTINGKKAGKKSRSRISVQAVPAAEPPAFHVHSEKFEDDKGRKTTPISSAEPSRTVIVPESQVHIEIVEQDKEDEEEAEEEIIEHETDIESEAEEAETTEHEDLADGNTTEDQQETATFSPVEEEEEPNVEASENEENVIE